MFVQIGDWKKYPVAYFNGTPTKEEIEELEAIDYGNPLEDNGYRGNVYIYCNERLPPCLKDTWIKRIWFDKHSDFDRPVKNLPQHLERVDFGKHFNHKVNKLPEFLKYLRVGYFFEKTLDYLPKGLEKLVIENPKYPFDLKHLPPNLKKLVVSTSFEKNIVLPEGCVLKRKEFEFIYKNI